MSETTVWSADQVQALAPDTSSYSAGRKLAQSKDWISTGSGGVPHSLWGLCQGSGKNPYQTCVDLEEPAYRCSCPSRKFPCKHALGLLLRWSEGRVQPDEPPQWVTEWHDGRAARATKKAEKAAAPKTEAQIKAAEKRAEQRKDKVSGGVAELRQWLTDQIRYGIAGLDQEGYRHFEPVAARLVDAQAPGLAAMVRRVAGVPSSGAGFADRLLGEFGLMHLLAVAASQVDSLPEDLAETVRSRVGQPATTEQVLATPPVRDDWQVVGLRDEVEERLTSRRVWLVGRQTGREALVLSFAAPGQTLAADLIVGTMLDADLCYYPGAGQVRALVAKRHSAPTACVVPWHSGTVANGLSRVADALALDPWLTGWPMLLHAAVAPGERWHLVDPGGQGLPLAMSAGDCWRWMATSGGRPADIAVEWSPQGLIPLTMYLDGEVVLA